VLYKKRWSDGLHNNFDHLDEFEAKFYCFGGDGGDSSGGGGSSSNNTPARDPDPSPNTGFRGEQSAAAPAPAPAMAMATAASPSMAAVSAQPATGFGLANVAPDAFVSSPVAPAPAPSVAQPVSFAPMPEMAAVPTTTVTAPSQAYNAATSDRTIGGLASMLGVDVPSSVNIGGYNVGFSSTPGTSGLAGPTVDLGPGTLGVGTTKDLDRVGIGYNVKFADGGIVTLRRR